MLRILGGGGLGSENYLRHEQSLELPKCCWRYHYPVSHFKLRGNWLPARASALVCVLNRRTDAVFGWPREGLPYSCLHV